MLGGLTWRALAEAGDWRSLKRLVQRRYSWEGAWNQLLRLDPSSVGLFGDSPQGCALHYRAGRAAVRSSVRARLSKRRLACMLGALPARAEAFRAALPLYQQVRGPKPWRWHSPGFPAWFGAVPLELLMPGLEACLSAGFAPLHEAETVAQVTAMLWTSSVLHDEPLDCQQPGDFLGEIFDEILAASRVEPLTREGLEELEWQSERGRLRADPSLTLLATALLGDRALRLHAVRLWVDLDPFQTEWRLESLLVLALPVPFEEALARRALDRRPWEAGRVLGWMERLAAEPEGRGLLERSLLEEVQERGPDELDSWIPSLLLVAETADPVGRRLGGGAEGSVLPREVQEVRADLLTLLLELARRRPDTRRNVEQTARLFLVGAALQRVL